MSRVDKLRRLVDLPPAHTVVRLAEALVEHWGSEVHAEDGERLDELGRAVDAFNGWLNEPEDA